MPDEQTIKSPEPEEHEPITPQRASRGRPEDGITDADERRGEEQREGSWREEPDGWEP